MALSPVEQIKRLVAAKYPVIYTLSWEERRVEGFIKKIAETGFSSPFKFCTWSQTEGLIQDGKVYPDTQDPVKALDVVIKLQDPSLFVFRDLQFFLTDDHPLVLRKVRDVYHANKNNFKAMFILSPILKIPAILSKEVTIVDFPLPEKPEMQSLVESTIQANKSLPEGLDDDLKQQFALACLGLTLDEARSSLSKAMIGKTKMTSDEIQFLLLEKANIIRKEGILEYIDNQGFSLDQVGGLDNLKEWLAMRSRFFSKEAADFGIDAPRGLLLTGVPGCGKSICVRAVASTWNLPVFRLDMDRIYGGSSPEENLRRAFKTVEAAAPACLWMDEIEKGVAGYASGGGDGIDARIFGMFLTWMQDKSKPVFVAATANEVDKLPPEILRKGRFDEIFFVDLPSEQERQEIFMIHLKLHKQDFGRFDLPLLAKGTNGFTGSEIEQVVMSGLYDAFANKRDLTNNDLHKASSKMVALSVTMSERIKELKRWAQYRAVKATKSAR